MNHHPPLLFLLGSLTLTASATAQVPPALSPVRKVVVHDHGGLWPEAFAVHTLGDVEVQGNPWLGGGSIPLLPMGVADLARLEALTSGAAEAVVMVGGSGLTTATWNPTTGVFDLVPWTEPLLFNAKMVRTAPFAPHQLVVVLAEDGKTLRVFRHNSTLMTSFTMAETVLDYEIVRNASGAARLFVVTNSGLSCRQPNGTLDWELAGAGGDVVRWTKDPTIRAGWMHRNDSGAWQIAWLGDSGSVLLENLGGTIGDNDDILAAFPTDCVGDGHVDWIVKTTAGLWGLVSDGTHFELVDLGAMQEPANPDSIPDLAVTHGGQHVYLVDEGPEGIAWTRLDMFAGDVSGDGINLDGNGVIDDDITPAPTKVDFVVRVSASWMQSFAKPNTTTHLQLVSWRQADTTPGGRLDNLAESNTLFPLAGTLVGVGETCWPLTVTMTPNSDWYPLGWSTEEHYWLTIRLVMVPDNIAEPMIASDPITLVTSLSKDQREESPDWPFVRSFLEPNPPPLPTVAPPPDQPVGGGVLGVIVRIKIPPPPPTGLPSPSDAFVENPIWQQ